MFFLMLFIAGYCIAQIDDISVLIAALCITVPVYLAIFLIAKPFKQSDFYCGCIATKKFVQEFIGE